MCGPKEIVILCNFQIQHGDLSIMFNGAEYFARSDNITVVDMEETVEPVTAKQEQRKDTRVVHLVIEKEIEATHVNTKPDLKSIIPGTILSLIAVIAVVAVVIVVGTFECWKYIFIYFSSG